MPSAMSKMSYYAISIP